MQRTAEGSGGADAGATQALRTHVRPPPFSPALLQATCKRCAQTHLPEPHHHMVDAQPEAQQHIPAARHDAHLQGRRMQRQPCRQISAHRLRGRAGKKPSLRPTRTWAGQQRRVSVWLTLAAPPPLAARLTLAAPPLPPAKMRTLRHSP